MISPYSVLLCLALFNILLVRGIPSVEGAAAQMKPDANNGQSAPPQTLICTLASGSSPGQKRSEEGPAIQMKPVYFQQGTSSSVEYTCKPPTSASNPASSPASSPGPGGISGQR